MVIYHDKVCAHICWYMDTIYIRDCQWGLLRARSRSGVGGKSQPCCFREVATLGRTGKQRQ